MENLPTYISIVFGLTTLLTVWLFYKASNGSKMTLIILLLWLTLQAFIGLSGFYTVTNAVPPRFMLLGFPPLLFIIGLFLTSKGRQYIRSLDIKYLTILHTVRIAVEMVLFWLFVQKTVPQLMTFEGRNFDILSGLTAPIIYYFGFVKKQLPNLVILIWNFICLGLLINIVVNVIISVKHQGLYWSRPRGQRDPRARVHRGWHQDLRLGLRQRLRSQSRDRSLQPRWQSR